MNKKRKLDNKDNKENSAEPTWWKIDFLSVLKCPKRGRYVVTRKFISGGELLFIEYPSPVQKDNVDLRLKELYPANMNKIPSENWVQDVMEHNCFGHSFPKKVNVKKGSLVYLHASLFNHSCLPNLRVQVTGDKCELRIWTLCDIQAGEELNVSYIGLIGASQNKKKRLDDLSTWFEICSCKMCVLPRNQSGTKIMRKLIQPLRDMQEIIINRNTLVPDLPLCTL